MTNSQLFKQAHAMTKQVIQTGDNYQATFSLCLKAVKADIKQDAINNTNFIVLAAIVLFIVNIANNVDFAITIVKILGLVLAAPLSIAAAILIDYNISF